MATQKPTSIHLHILIYMAGILAFSTPTHALGQPPKTQSEDPPEIPDHYTHLHGQSNGLTFTNTNWNETIIPSTPFVVTWNETLDSGTLSLATVATINQTSSEPELEVVSLITSNISTTSYTWIPDPLILSNTMLYVLLLTATSITPKHDNNGSIEPPINIHAISPAFLPSSPSPESPNTKTLVGPAVGIVAAGILINAVSLIAIREHRRRKSEARRREGERRREEDEDGMSDGSADTWVDYDYEDPIAYPVPVYARGGWVRASVTRGEGGGMSEVEREASGTSVFRVEGGVRLSVGEHRVWVGANRASVDAIDPGSSTEGSDNREERKQC